MKSQYEVIRFRVLCVMGVHVHAYACVRVHVCVVCVYAHAHVCTCVCLCVLETNDGNHHYSHHLNLFYLPNGFVAINQVTCRQIFRTNKGSHHRVITAHYLR